MDSATRTNRCRCRPRAQLHLYAGPIGFLLACLALSNLVQGVWQGKVPWLNLTAVALSGLMLFFIFSPLRQALPKPTGLMILCFSFLPGFFYPLLNPESASKRFDIAIAVILPVLLVYVLARSPRLIHGFALGTLLLGAIVSLSQWMIPDPMILASGRRTPVGNNAISTGRILGLAAILMFVLALSRRGVCRAWFLITSGLFLLGALTAASRGPLLAFLIAVFGILVSLPRASLRILTLVSVAVSGGVIQAAYFYSPESRIFSSDDSGRSELFVSAWEVVKDNPLGVGWGNLYNYLPAHIVNPAQGYVQYPHNVLLEFAAEGGLFSAALILIVLCATGGAAYSMRRTTMGLFLWGAFIFSVVGALFSSDVVGNRLLWVVCALTLGLRARGFHDGYAEPKRVHSSSQTARGQL